MPVPRRAIANRTCPPCAGTKASLLRAKPPKGGDAEPSGLPRTPSAMLAGPPAFRLHVEIGGPAFFGAGPLGRSGPMAGTRRVRGNVARLRGGELAGARRPGTSAQAPPPAPG